MDYHRKHSVKAKIIRIFNTYGPNMAVDDGRVISNFIVQALQGKPLTVHGDGRQTRSFQYVADLIDAMMLMVATDDNITGPVNIGNPDERTIEDVARTIIRMTGSKSTLANTDRPADDPCRRCPDISLAKEILCGWEPKVELEDGLRHTIEYFKQQIAVKEVI